MGQPAREPKVVSMEPKEKDPCRKFVIELGDYRTEPEVLAELHLRYPWVKLGRRNGVSSNSTMDERSRALLAELRNINGKPCSFRPLESGHRRTYILMGGSEVHYLPASSAGRASPGSRTDDSMGPSSQTGNQKSKVAQVVDRAKKHSVP